MSGRRSFAAMLGIGLAVAGCGSSVHDTVLSQGASDLDCPREATTPWIVDVGHYDARGCGRHREYKCQLEKSGVTCVATGDVGLAPARATGWSGLTPQASLEVELGSVTPDVLACRPGAKRLDVPYRVLAGKGSSGIRSDGKQEEIKDAEAQCVVKALSNRKIPEKVPRFDQEERLKLAYTFSNEAPPIVTPAPLSPVSPPVAPAPANEAPAPAPAATPEDEVDARVRALIVENGEIIKTCVGTTPVAVEARYDESGKVLLSLRGDQRDSPVGRCVTTALPNLSVASPGRSGSVIHLVR